VVDDCFSPLCTLCTPVPDALSVSYPIVSSMDRMIQFHSVQSKLRPLPVSRLRHPYPDLNRPPSPRVRLIRVQTLSHTSHITHHLKHNSTSPPYSTVTSAPLFTTVQSPLSHTEHRTHNMSPLRRKITFPRKTFALHHQHRTFLGLQRHPHPKPPMMAYLVLQGLAISLIADFGIATMLGHKTVVREVAMSAGYWKEERAFGEVHDGKK
jgi:hypothetical protein